jgi:uncharacterized protein (TIGR02266 family)
MAGLEACQADAAVAGSLDALAQSLAQAQGKLFSASKLAPDSHAAVDMMRRAMDFLAQALKVLQEVQGGGDAVATAAGSIAQALQTLHPVVQNAKQQEARRSLPPAPASDTLNVNVNTMLNMSTDHQFYSGFSENIEEGGIFVATFDPKPINSKVIINFQLPGGRPVTARGTVHFVREYNPTVPDMAPGMGVRFTDLMPRDKEAIEEYLEQRAPMFYDDGS